MLSTELALTCTSGSVNLLPVSLQQFPRRSRFVEMAPGAQYHVHFLSESMDRKVVALWVDGQKVFSNTYWLEPGDVLDIRGERSCAESTCCCTCCCSCLT